MVKKTPTTKRLKTPQNKPRASLLQKLPASPVYSSDTHEDDSLQPSPRLESFNLRRTEALLALSGQEYPERFALRSAEVSQLVDFVRGCERTKGK